MVSLRLILLVAIIAIFSAPAAPMGQVSISLAVLDDDDADDAADSSLPVSSSHVPNLPSSTSPLVPESVLVLDDLGRAGLDPTTEDSTSRPLAGDLSTEAIGQGASTDSLSVVSLPLRC